MTDKIKVYNTALRYCGERSLASLTENREPRRLLDAVYDNGGIDTCLEEGLWKFATCTIRLDYDTTIDPEFGYRRGFSKPDDWVKTAAVCSDEYFDTPLTRYVHENNYWYADLDEIFVRYISKSTAFGYDLSLWPQTFADYVSAHFANEIVWKLTKNDKTEAKVAKYLKDNKATAKAKDAWNQPQAFPAPGSWVTSRGRTSGDTRDRGNRHQLLG